MASFSRAFEENISDNMLMGAVNAVGAETNCVWNRLEKQLWVCFRVAKEYKAAGLPSMMSGRRKLWEGVEQRACCHGAALLECARHIGKEFCPYS